MSDLRQIRAGLLGCSPGWEELLQQEGIPSASVVPDESNLTVDFSVVILSREATPDEQSLLREYLRAGGALISYSGYCTGLATVLKDPVQIRYIRPDSSERFRGSSLLDVESQGMLPQEANAFRTDENLFAIFAGELGGGVAIILPFEPGELVEDFGASERYFYARPERLPSERVSRRGKGEMLHLLHGMLAYLHHQRGLPYARLWQFPDGAGNVFGFRVDTDGGTLSEIDELYTQLREADLSCSWFLDVGSHETWLDRFRMMEGQEIGLHCYTHRVYLDRSRDSENIVRGLSAMRTAGLAANAFVAPFGFWSPELGNTIDQYGFAYSSEFGWAYDTLPLHPVCRNTRFTTLQVPIHPISIGSLRKAGYSSAEMIRYFQDVMERKTLRHEPLIFYHHPGHRYPDVVQSILDRAMATQARTMSLGAFASWWKERAAVVPSFCLDDGRLISGDRNPHPPPTSNQMWFEVAAKDGSSAVFPLGSTLTLKDVAGNAHPEYSPPEDIARIREFDLRGAIGRQFTRFQRRFT
jgi:hypothetical protein